MRKLHPDFKTIADFRKENRKQLKQVFKQFNLFCKECDLFGGELVGIDGTKFRADNSKRNNYNQKKIDRQLKYIQEKTDAYFQTLDENDEEAEMPSKYTVKQMQEKIEKLKQRKDFYEKLQKELKSGKDNEISTTDCDARLMDNKKNGLEVGYNVQIAVDAKNKLIVANEVTNNPADQGHLNNMAQAAKETFGMDEKEGLEVVADKGYYQGEDLKKSAENGTVPYVTHQVYSNATGHREYYSDKFKYDCVEDVYVCPEGKVLYRTKHRAKKPERIQYKNFEACKSCPNKDKCTKSSKGRIISRSKHQEFLDTIDARTAENMDKYLKRQTIVEHPFGTVKRSMDAGYFLTRGLESVAGEADLVFLAYNMKRAINILGVKAIMEKIKAKASLIFSIFRNQFVFCTEIIL